MQSDCFDLFEEFEQATSCNSTTPLLDYYVQQGFVFLTPDQVMKVTGKTWGQLRYAIYNYDLDCYIPCGEYRIAVQSLKDYIAGAQDEIDQLSHNVMLQRELSGVHDLVFEGRIQEAYSSLISHGYSASDIDELLRKDKQWIYDSMPEGSTKADDYYDVPALGLEDMPLYDFATLLQVSTKKLQDEMDIRDYSTVLTKNVVNDYLVIKQFLNANIPVKIPTSQNLSNDDGQLFLF